MRRHLFVGFVVLQALVLVGWAASLEQARARATLVRLEIVPVDPRDLLHGDYIVLNYTISTLPESELVGRRPEWSDAGRTIYVALAPRDGRHVAVAASLEREALPSGGDRRLIVGRLRQAPLRDNPGGPRGVEYGIERYYVPEGKGNPPPGRMEAEVALTVDGRAFLTRLLVDGKPYP